MFDAYFSTEEDSIMLAESSWNSLQNDEQLKICQIWNESFKEVLDAISAKKKEEEKKKEAEKAAKK